MSAQPLAAAPAREWTHEVLPTGPGGILEVHLVRRVDLNGRPQWVNAAGHVYCRQRWAFLPSTTPAQDA